MIPLNQSYRIAETIATRPDVAALTIEFRSWLKNVVRWTPYDTNPEIGYSPGQVHIGRYYDAALTMASIDFTGLRILELGARFSFLGSYLTGVAAEVHVSDLFANDQAGNLDQWDRLWSGAARRPERLHTGPIDMRTTGCADNAFDVVLNISAIEHVPDYGDIVTMIEMGRIVRPGGFIVIGTDISDRFRIKRGKYYDEDAIYERLIEPSGCSLYGPADLSWAGCENKSPHRDGGFDRSACLFVLQKEAL